ncbi:hypothetical protein FQZ97_1076910 [compost metagenome]
MQHLSAQQNTVQLKHMVTGLPVGAAPLPARIRIDHAADGRAVGCRELRRKEKAVRTQRGIELILDDPTLHAYPALLDVDLQDLRQVPGEVDDQAFGQRLAVRTRATTSRRQHNASESGACHQGSQTGHISRVQRKHNRLRHALVDGVVSRQHRTCCVLRGNLPAKTRVA